MACNPMKDEITSEYFDVINELIEQLLENYDGDECWELASMHAAA